MVEWLDQLYLDGFTKRAAKHIKEKVEKEKFQYPVFCVSLAFNPDNLLDIINVNELLFPYYKKQTCYILGLASSRRQAMIMAAAILTKLYRETGSLDVRSFYQKKFQGVFSSKNTKEE